MTDVTTVDAAVLVGAAARFEEAAAGLRALLDALLARLAAWREAWQGAGGSAFEETREAWARDQEALVGALAEMGVALRATAARYAATDEDAAGRVVTAGASLVPGCAGGRC